MTGSVLCVFRILKSPGRQVLPLRHGNAGTRHRRSAASGPVALATARGALALGGANLRRGPDLRRSACGACPIDRLAFQLGLEDPAQVGPIMKSLVGAAGQQGGGWLRRQERILSLAIGGRRAPEPPSPAGRLPPPRPPAAAEPEEQRTDPDQQNQGEENGIRGGGFAESRHDRLDWLGVGVFAQCLGNDLWDGRAFLHNHIYNLPYVKGELKRTIKKRARFNSAAYDHNDPLRQEFFVAQNEIQQYSLQWIYLRSHCRKLAVGSAWKEFRSRQEAAPRLRHLPATSGSTAAVRRGRLQPPPDSPPRWPGSPPRTQAGGAAPGRWARTHRHR